MDVEGEDRVVRGGELAPGRVLAGEGAPRRGVEGELGGDAAVGRREDIAAPGRRDAEADLILVERDLRRDARAEDGGVALGAHAEAVDVDAPAERARPALRDGLR